MRRFSIVALLFLTGLPTVAWAQSADEANSAALEAFDAGRFEEAAAGFAAAYAIEADPTFRKSEAVAWFKAERCDEAIVAANAYLHHMAEDDSPVEAQAVVANCKTNLAQHATEAGSFDLAERLLFEAESAAPDDYTRDRVMAARVALADARQKVGEPNGDGQVTSPPVVEERRPSTVPGWVMIGAGAAAIATGAIWHGVTLGSTVPKLEDEANGGDEELHKKLSNRVSIARTMVWVLYGLGGAGVGIGGWYVIKNSDEGRNQPKVGLSFSGRF